MNHRIIILCASILTLLPSTTFASADFNNNGKVDFTDFILFARAFGSTDTNYDLDNNGKVDFLDFTQF
ncbi:MAG: dockerin type I domain-containing protein, partial [Candidatus Latescibacteria bacterium]|nr:dockerin type I domain-containing protein [Candidatus Latescibacterota bacterium]